MRVPLIDPVKAVAAHLIVLHHLMLYSSMRGAFHEAAPAIAGFLADPARYAVQVFLVIGGFLSMQGLMRRLTASAASAVKPVSTGELIRLLFNRYRRLARPYALALLVACAALVWVQHIDPVIELTPATPEQLLAHLLLVHDLVDTPSLSAGVWYVAIDFQLYAMGVLLLTAASRLGGSHPNHPATLFIAAVTTLTVVSLLLLNRMPTLDSLGVYFFGSYGLGMLTWLAVYHRREGSTAVLLCLLVALAQSVEYRERLWVTLATALFLLVAPRVQRLPAWLASRTGQFFQQSSYPLFLIHYPLSIALFASIEQLYLLSLIENLLAAAVCWCVFVAGAWGLMRAEQRVFDYTLKDEPQPQVLSALGLSTTKRESQSSRV